MLSRETKLSSSSLRSITEMSSSTSSKLRLFFGWLRVCSSNGSFFEFTILHGIPFLVWDFPRLSVRFDNGESLTFLPFSSLSGMPSRLLSEEPALVSLPFELREGVRFLRITNLWLSVSFSASHTAGDSSSKPRSRSSRFSRRMSYSFLREAWRSLLAAAFWATGCF